MKTNSKYHAAMVVAHPDDEILWGGGLLLNCPDWNWRIASICRGGDSERALRFRRVLSELDADGDIADLDDGSEQRPLESRELDGAVVDLLGPRCWDLVVTHGPAGEYTRHRRHEEVCDSVVRLWERGRVRLRKLWMFAFEDGDGNYLPRAREDASIFADLDNCAWKEKYRLITEVYGFAMDTWEARVTPRAEAFESFANPIDARSFVKKNSGAIVSTTGP